MATPTNFIRDWVFNVIAPFLTQLKNRLANIKLTYDLSRNRLNFYNAENELNVIDLHPPYHNGILTVYPRFARVSSGTSTTKGFLVIKLPESLPDYTMFSVYIDIFIYRWSQSFSCLLAGYNYPNTPRWYNMTGRGLSKVPTDKNTVKFVRFLDDGGDPSNNADYNRYGYIIGNSDDTIWPYAKVAVTKVIAGYRVGDDPYVIDNYDWEMGWYLEADIPEHVVDGERNMNN